MNSSLWNQYRLGDLVKLTQGFCVNKKSNHLVVGSGLPLLRITDMINRNEEIFISYNVPKRFIAKEEDIIFTRTGQVGLVFRGQYGVIHNNCFSVSPLSDNITRNFLFWLLRSDMVRKKANYLACGAAQPDLKHPAFKSIVVKIPVKISTQETISEILSDYDNFIDTNSRRIQLLEESARLLFREWFVYFKFPNHEKVKMVDRGGKNIPAEWEYLPFTKIKLFKKAPLGVPVFTGTRQYCQTSEIDGTSITGNGEEVDYESRPSRADIAPRINTLYFAKMKDTDKVLYFNMGNSDLLEKILLSTGMVGFTTEEKYLGFLFGLLTSYEFVQYKNNFATGATQVSLNDASLKKIKVLLPTLNLVELYSEIVNPLLEECSLLRSQNQQLTYARDLLLPRLMSGAIEV
jgi:type I restriction enzyme S subunit